MDAMLVLKQIAAFLKDLGTPTPGEAEAYRVVFTALFVVYALLIAAAVF